jgi:hypothetical protein
VKVYFILFFILSGPAWALGPRPSESECLSLFTKLYQETRRAAFLDKDDQAEIARLAADASLSSGQKSRLIFERILEARIRHAEPDVARHVRDSLAKMRKSHRRTVDGFYNPLLRRSEASVPEYLDESAVEFMVKIHEMQHAYQHQFLRKRGRVFAITGTKKRLRAESDAMSLEKIYLRSIPREVREELLVKLRADGKMNKKVKSWIEAALVNADASTQDYLKKQRSLGRYSKLSVDVPNKFMVGIVGLGVVELLYLFVNEANED